jgi:predicted O-linked N-acetylglucosamine transferase (SPINDLY family)
MDNWIAKDKDEYFQKAINFSKDINNLNLIRKKLNYI